MSILKIYFPNYYLNNVKKNREKKPALIHVLTYVFKAICKSMSIKFLYRIYKRMRIKKISYKKNGQSQKKYFSFHPFHLEFVAKAFKRGLPFAETMLLSFVVSNSDQSEREWDEFSFRASWKNFVCCILSIIYRNRKCSLNGIHTKLGLKTYFASSIRET